MSREDLTGRTAAPWTFNVAAHGPGVRPRRRRPAAHLRRPRRPGSCRGSRRGGHGPGRRPAHGRRPGARERWRPAAGPRGSTRQQQPGPASVAHVRPNRQQGGQHQQHGVAGRRHVGADPAHGVAVAADGLPDELLGSVVGHAHRFTPDADAALTRGPRRGAPGVSAASARRSTISRRRAPTRSR